MEKAYLFSPELSQRAHLLIQAFLAVDRPPFSRLPGTGILAKKAFFPSQHYIWNRGREKIKRPLSWLECRILIMLCDDLGPCSLTKQTLSPPPGENGALSWMATYPYALTVPLPH